MDNAIIEKTTRDIEMKFRKANSPKKIDYVSGTLSTVSRLLFIYFAFSINYSFASDCSGGTITISTSQD